METLPIFQVDSFTSKPFKGNPAGVCLLNEQMSESWMQNVASEMNLSETAFLLEQKDGFNLRWFTPAVEVDLCGHATLASAHVLWEERILKPEDTARFFSRSGPLYARRKGSWIELDFPSDPPKPADEPDGLSGVLGARPIHVERCGLGYLLELGSEDELVGLKPDFSRLNQITDCAIIVTCRDVSGKYDFLSRFFAPTFGIDEDPVTGAAHCALAPYWAAKLGKKEMTGYQASARGGVVRVKPEGERVYLSGEAVTVLQGSLIL
jgi:PhzF family phenazine biosynthesis protein